MKNVIINIDIKKIYPNPEQPRKTFENIEDELVDIFDEVLEYSEKLIIIIKNTLIYINEKCLINVK